MFHTLYYITYTKLKVKEANELVFKILQAIVIDDDLVTTDDDSGKENETEADTEHETDSEDECNKTIKPIPQKDDGLVKNSWI